MATDPRTHHHHRSKHLGTAAKQTDELGDKAQANGFTSPNDHVGSLSAVVGVSTTAGGSDASIGWKCGRSYLSLGDHVGSPIIIIIIEASNLDEGQGLDTSH